MNRRGLFGKEEHRYEEILIFTWTLIFLKLSVTVFHNRFSCDQSNKGALIIYHRNVVLIDGTIQQILHVGICVYRFISCSSWDCHNGNFSRVCLKVSSSNMYATSLFGVRKNKIFTLLPHYCIALVFSYTPKKPGDLYYNNDSMRQCFCQ